MRIVTSVAAMKRLAKRWQQSGIRVGIVPTMGFLHEGHLSLVRRARRLVAKAGNVVVSIYVNPTQFGPGEDFARYPRDLKRDLKLCTAEGVDVVFAPSDSQMYPRKGGGAFSTYVVEESLSHGMEGAARPGHFRGVTTIVAKLLNIVLPDVAVFGAKDYQQAAIIKRMARDLSFPVKIAVAPTLREQDGLAMSSRNKFLSSDERVQAVALWQAIQQARQAVSSSKAPTSAIRLKSELRCLFETRPATRVNYIEFFDPGTLAPVTTVTRGTHMALAVFVGNTRLIDNAKL